MVESAGCSGAEIRGDYLFASRLARATWGARGTVGPSEVGDEKGEKRGEGGKESKIHDGMES